MSKFTQTAYRRCQALAITLTAVSVVALSACSSSSDSSSSSAGGVLVVGSDLTYPPYASLDGSKPIGFDPDIIHALAKASNERVKFKDTRFEQLIPNLKAHQIDVIASALYITAERAKQVDFIPYFSTGNSIVSSKKGDQIADVSGLCGRKVAVIKGGDIVQRLRKEASKTCTDAGKKAVDVREFTTDPEATQALISGQVDAQVTDAAVAAGLSKKTNGAVQITSTELLYPIPVGLAVDKGDEKLRKILVAALGKIKADGTYQKLLKTYNLAEVDQPQVDKILGN